MILTLLRRTDSRRLLRLLHRNLTASAFGHVISAPAAFKRSPFPSITLGLLEQSSSSNLDPTRTLLSPLRLHSIPNATISWIGHSYSQKARWIPILFSARCVQPQSPLSYSISFVSLSSIGFFPWLCRAVTSLFEQSKIHHEAT